MTIKELKPLVGAAWLKAHDDANYLAKSENPQIQKVQYAAAARAHILQAIISALNGDCVELKIYGEVPE